MRFQGGGKEIRGPDRADALAIAEICNAHQMWGQYAGAAVARAKRMIWQESQTQSDYPRADHLLMSARGHLVMFRYADMAAFPRGRVVSPVTDPLWSARPHASFRLSTWWKKKQRADLCSRGGANVLGYSWRALADGSSLQCAADGTPVKGPKASPRSRSVLG